MQSEVPELAGGALWGAAAPAAAARTELAARYREHRRNLVRLAVLLVGDRETAEDVVPDVFARLHDVRPEALTLAYIRTCVLNRSRSVLRPAPGHLG